MVWEKPEKARDGLGTSSKSSEMVPEKLRTGLEEAQKLVWEKPKRSRKWSGRSPEKLRNGLEKPNEKPQKALESPKQGGKVHRQFFGGDQGAPAILLRGGPGCTGNGLRGQGAPAIVLNRRLERGPGCPGDCLGFRVFTFDTQRLDRFDGKCGPYLA